MSRVKVKIRGIEYEGEHSTLYLIGNRKVWLPDSRTEYEGNYVVIPKWLAERNGLPYKQVFNRPPSIVPEPNQEPLDELEYRPE